MRLNFSTKPQTRKEKADHVPTCMAYKYHYESNQYIEITDRKYRLLNKTFLN